MGRGLELRMVPDPRFLRGHFVYVEDVVMQEGTGAHAFESRSR